MAINPQISLQLKDRDLASSQIRNFEAGRQVTQGIGQQDIRQQILNQQSQMQQMSIAQQQGQYMNQLAKGLIGKPLAERASIVAQQIPFLQQLGIDPAQVIGADKSDQGLNAIITKTEPFMSKGTTRAPTEFENLSSRLSQEDQDRAVRIKFGLEASAGRSQIKEVSPGVFMNYDPNNKTMSDPFKFDANGQQIPLTREEQLTLRLGEDVEGITTKGAAETEVDVDKQRRLNELALDKELAETNMKDLGVRRKTFIGQGVAAKDSIPNINRMIELNDRVITGGVTALTKIATDFLGMTSADIGEFNRRSSELVLGTIRQLGANPTEGERAFLEKIQPSVGQSNEVNAAILKDLKTIAERQAARAKKLQANPNLDPNQLILDEPDFVPSFSGGSGGQGQAQQSRTPPVTTNGAFDSAAYVDSLFK